MGFGYVSILVEMNFKPKTTQEKNHDFLAGRAERTEKMQRMLNSRELF